MKVLITGASGYIGENLCRHLEKSGNKVFKYDRKIPLLDNASIDDLSKYDGVVHLAALSGIKACQDNFDQAVQDNVSFAFRIFYNAYLAGTPVVFTSSQAAKTPLASAYASMKRSTEIMAADIVNMGGDIRVFRLTNVFGGYKYIAKKNTVIGKFLKKKLSGEVIPVDGDGGQTRDFIHVEDVCKFIELALRHKDKIRVPVDIGTGIETSVLDLAKMFAHSFAFTDSRNVGEKSNVADVIESTGLFGYRAKPRIIEYINTRPDLLS